MRRFLLFLLLLILIGFAIWNKYCRKTPVPVTNIKEFPITVDGKQQTVETPFVEKEVIMNFDGTDPVGQAELTQYLLSKNFKKVDSCSCTKGIELWRYAGADDVELNGIVGDVPKQPTEAVGLGLNYVVGFVSPRPTDQIPVNTKNTNPVSPKKTVVGVIDSGVDTVHSVIKDFLFKNTTANPACNGKPEGRYGYNSANPASPEPVDGFGHGTHINGIISGMFDNESGDHYGVELDLLNVKFADGASSTLFDAICGAYYAIDKGAGVINASWGYHDTVAPMLFESLLKTLQTKNVAMVAAVGNDTVHIDGALKFWPAAFCTSNPNVISVGAFDWPNDVAAVFSNYGNEVDVYASGVNIRSSAPVNQFGVNSGSSMAAGFVSRTVAIMRARGVPVGQIKTFIRNNAEARAVNLHGDPVTVRKHRHSNAITVGGGI
jgi:Subtilase family